MSMENRRGSSASSSSFETVSATSGHGAEKGLDEDTIPVTLLRCKSSGRVLFLEAGKDFVDILLSFLVLPAGTVISLLSQGGKVKNMGGISNIFESVKKLEDSLLYIDKETLTNPKPATGFRQPGLLQLDSNPEPSCTQFYGCGANCGRMSTSANMRCTCNNYFSRPLNIVEKPADQKSTSKAGYVKKSITYIVTDNLEITASSTIKSINVINEMKIDKMSDLVSTNLCVRKTQVLRLLEAALTSNSALNEVFGKK